jgi:2-phosphoglycerate kinase
LPGLSAVIKDRLEENIPMILEGDFILPELAASFNNPRIKTIFIHEPSREQILQNYLSREGTNQAHRADISFAWGNKLKEKCQAHNIPVIESRPWDTLPERVTSHL